VQPPGKKRGGLPWVTSPAKRFPNRKVTRNLSEDQGEACLSFESQGRRGVKQEERTSRGTKFLAEGGVGKKINKNGSYAIWGALNKKELQ